MECSVRRLGLWCTILSIISVLHSCNEKDLESASSGLQEVTEFDVRAVNGYLEFKDQASLDSLKAQLADKSREELDAWESQFKGFTSLRSLDEQSVDAQEAWFEELGNMNEEDRQLLMEGDADFWYSDYIKGHASSFILEDSGLYVLNTTAAGHDMLSFLNEDGIIKVDGKIFLHKRDVVKVITDGDDSKLQYLGEIESNNEKLGIIVLNNLQNKGVPENAFQITAYGATTRARRTCENRTGNSTGSDRVTAELLAENFVEPSCSDFCAFTWGKVSVVAYNWSKTLFGGWRRKKTSALSVQGNVSIIYSFAPTVIHIPVNASVNSQQNHVTVNIWASSATYDYDAYIWNAELYAHGNLIVYGRGGTMCGDVIPPFDDNDQPWN